MKNILKVLLWKLFLGVVDLQNPNKNKSGNKISGWNETIWTDEKEKMLPMLLWLMESGIQWGLNNNMGL